MNETKLAQNWADGAPSWKPRKFQQLFGRGGFPAVGMKWAKDFERSESAILLVE